MNAKTETLDILFGVRDSISDIIISLNPQDPAQREGLQMLLKQRDRITGMIQIIIASIFDDATAGLSEAIAQLEKAGDAIAALQKTLDGIKRAVEISDEVIQLAAAVIALAV